MAHHPDQFLKMGFLHQIPFPCDCPVQAKRRLVNSGFCWRQWQVLHGHALGFAAGDGSKEHRGSPCAVTSMDSAHPRVFTSRSGWHRYGIR